MKVLVIDTGLSLDIVKYLVKEGHEVYYYISWQKAHPTLDDVSYGEGLFEEWGVKRVDNFYYLIEDVDLILFTDIGWGDDINFLRKKGYKVFGASKDGELLENDRMKAKDIAQEFGIKVPRTEEMGIQEAIDFVKEEGELFVIKFSKVRTDKMSTYVPVSNEDCLWYLGKVIDMDSGAAVVLEEFIDGVEVAVSGFFDGEKFLRPYLINFEHKKLMDGEVGPNTGEMGTLMFFTYDENLPFIKYFKQWERYLKEISYVGIFDMACIANKDGYFLLECTSRWGFPTVYILMPLLEEGIGEVIRKTVDGGNQEFRAKENVWACGICLNVEGYPYDEIVNKQGFVKIYGIDEALEAKCSLGFAALVKRDGEYFSCSGHGRVLVPVGLGEVILEAREDAYRAIDYVSFSNMIYRLDIGLKVRRKLKELVEWGIVPESMMKKEFKKSGYHV